MLPIKKTESWLIKIEKLPQLRETQLPALPEQTKQYFMPLVNFWETASYFEIQLLIGNLNKETLSIQLVEQFLIIKGEVISLLAEQMNSYLQEIPTGCFEKHFVLRQVIDNEQIIANYTDGILSIIILKKITKDLTTSIIEYL